MGTIQGIFVLCYPRESWCQALVRRSPSPCRLQCVMRSCVAVVPYRAATPTDCAVVDGTRALKAPTEIEHSRVTLSKPCGVLVTFQLEFTLSAINKGANTALNRQWQH